MTMVRPLNIIKQRKYISVLWFVWPHWPVYDCNFDIQPCQLWFTEDSSPSVAPEHRSLSHPRLAPGSPDSRLCRKLSPVEIYYEMRTRRNSASSSVRWAEGEDKMFPQADMREVYAIMITYEFVDVDPARVTHSQEVHPMWRAEVFQPHRCCPVLHQWASMWGNGSFIYRPFLLLYVHYG